MSEYAIVITGSRGLTGPSYEAIVDRAMFEAQDRVEVYIVGDAKGIDEIARSLGEGYCDVEQYDADWDRYRKAAGPIRNGEMLDHPGVEEVWAFWDGSSPGTLDCIKQAVMRNIKVTIWPLDV